MQPRRLEEAAAFARGDFVIESPAVALDLQRHFDAGMFRRIWSLGHAGVEVPLQIERDGRTLDHKVASGERSRFFKAPRLH